TEFGLEIGAGLGPLKGKIWRFGLMGYSCRPDNVMLCLSALGSLLNDMALPVHVGDAEAAAHGAYAQMHVKDAQRKKRAASKSGLKIGVRARRARNDRRWRSERIV